MQPDLQLLVQGTQGPKQGRGKAIGRPKARYQKQRERASDQQDRPSPLRLLSFPCSSKPPQNSSCFFRTSVPAPVVWVPSPLQPNPDDSSRYYESTKGPVQIGRFLASFGEGDPLNLRIGLGGS